MSTFKRIAAAIAFSPRAEANICETKRFADQLGAELILIHIGSDDDAAHVAFDELLKCSGIEPAEVKQVWRSGDPVKEIAQIIDEEQIDLLVVGALPKEGLFKYFVGSIARKICREVSCSVLLLTNPQKADRPCRRIALNSADKSCDGHTLDVAFRLADLLHAEEVHLCQELDPHEVHVKVEDDSTLDEFNRAKELMKQKETERLAKLLNAVKGPQSARLKTDFIFGKPGVTLAHFTQSIGGDLLVMNAPSDRARLIKRLFVSGIEYILGDLPCDLLLVRKLN